jgi:hypothetical protein
MRLDYLVIMVIILVSNGCSNSYCEFYDNGKKRVCYEIDNSMKNGKYVEYYQSGNISVSGFYKEDNKTGIWLEYFENGMLKSKGAMLNGYFLDSVSFYNENGTIVQVDYYGYNGQSIKSKFYESKNYVHYQIYFKEKQDTVKLNYQYIPLICIDESGCVINRILLGTEDSEGRFIVSEIVDSGDASCVSVELLNHQIGRNLVSGIVEYTRFDSPDRTVMQSFELEYFAY